MKPNQPYIDLTAENTCEANICDLLDEIGMLKANQDSLLERFKTLTKPVLNLQEASLYLGISKTYLYKLNSQNKIPYCRPNEGKITYQKEDLDKYLKSNKRNSLSELEQGLL
jgi:excisionase family DNA binding protein